MKTREDVLRFQESLIKTYEKTCNHENGLKYGFQVCKCDCKKRIALQARLYKYNVPEKFWSYSKNDVRASKDIYEDIVKSYCQHLNRALKNGLGIYFTGDNGTGKTLFMCLMAKYIAMKTNYSIYYTTMPMLVQNFYRSNGFTEQSMELRSRLNDCLMNTDFLFIDEMGKGDVTPSTKLFIEMVLRHRHDNKLPVIFASNVSVSDLSKEGTDSNYGATIQSIIDGCCEPVYTDPGDFRPKVYAKLAETLYGQSNKQQIDLEDI